MGCSLLFSTLFLGTRLLLNGSSCREYREGLPSSVVLILEFLFSTKLELPSLLGTFPPSLTRGPSVSSEGASSVILSTKEFLVFELPSATMPLDASRTLDASWLTEMDLSLTRATVSSSSSATTSLTSLSSILPARLLSRS